MNLAAIEQEIVALLDTFHDGQREKKARAIVAEIVAPLLKASEGYDPTATPQVREMARAMVVLRRARDQLDGDLDCMARHANVLSERWHAAEARNGALEAALSDLLMTYADGDNEGLHGFEHDDADCPTCQVIARAQVTLSAKTEIEGQP